MRSRVGTTAGVAQALAVAGGIAFLLAGGIGIRTLAGVSVTVLALASLAAGVLLGSVRSWTGGRRRQAVAEGVGTLGFVLVLLGATAPDEALSLVGGGLVAVAGVRFLAAGRSPPG
ncbi:hypothetical protein ACFQPA_00455 [Halomarina halobia]|uniref:Integral membrane protein n=1 Tax=Halomarina halobia TaxID=3033386 RepID=A0ABD6A7R7_9EURY|nr:hypothetical protein [Halomarina sp. PSR21]